MDHPGLAGEAAERSIRAVARYDGKNAVITGGTSGFGLVDLLFANAGLTRSVPLESMTEDVCDELQRGEPGPH